MPDSVRDFDSLLRRNAQTHPDAPALIDSQEAIDWAELDRRTNRLANALLQRGIGKQDRVAAMGCNSIGYAVLMCAVQRIGACFVPLPTMTTPEALVMMINDSGSKLLFVSAGYAAPVLEHEAELTGLLPGGLMSLDEGDGTRIALSEFGANASNQPPQVTLEPDLPFNLIYSSGTTGAPKGIMIDRRFRNEEVRDLGGGFGFGPHTRSLVSTPLCSNTTLFQFLAVLAAGGSLVLMEKFDTRRFLELSEQNRITHAILVPVQYTRLLADPEFDRFDLSSYAFKASTSAPLNASMKKELLERWPAGGFVEFYGMTEGGLHCALFAHERPDKLDTVGQQAPSAVLKIIDEEGNELPTGQAGEIVGRSRKMMVGYHNREDATQEASWYDAEGLRYQRSGDIGWLDDEGFVHLLDRKKDMIISGGFNIYASDLENALLKHPDVVEAAVVGAPSEKWGETPVAFVVAGSRGANAMGLQIWVNAFLGKVQQISEVRIVDELPRNAIGKVLKRDLREQL